MFNDYRRNLRICAERFGIVVKRGYYRVKHVVPGGDVEPWMVELEDCEEPLPAAGVATWKTQDPTARHTTGNLRAKLSQHGIHTVHSSTDLKDNETWEKQRLRHKKESSVLSVLETRPRISAQPSFGIVARGMAVLLSMLQFASSLLCFLVGDTDSFG